MASALNPHPRGSSGQGSVEIDVSGGNQVLAVHGRALHIDTDGTIKFKMPDGSVCGPINVKGGVCYDYGVTLIYEDDTTATGSVIL